jgi:hypothetical protein
MNAQLLKGKSAQKSYKEMQQSARTSDVSLQTQVEDNTTRSWLEVRTKEQDDHKHPGRKIEVEAMFCTWCEYTL